MNETETETMESAHEGPESMGMSVSCPWMSMYFSVAELVQQNPRKTVNPRTCCRVRGLTM